MGVKAALREDDLILALKDGNVDRKVTEKAMSMVIAALCGRALRSIQYYNDAKTAWSKLEQKYLRSTMMNRLEVMKSHLNTRYINDMDMGDHVLRLELQFSRPETIGYCLEEPMKLAIVLSSMNSREEYAPFISSIHKMKRRHCQMDLSDHCIIKEHESLKSGLGESVKHSRNDETYIASSSRRHTHDV